MSNIIGYMEKLRSYAEDSQSGRQPATASVADALREAILRGALKGGEPLRQDGIAKQFGVSQVTVREALRLLAQEGLVALTPRRGAAVYSLSPDDVAEITDLRATLEGKLIEASIPNLTEEDLQAAEVTLEKLEKSRSLDNRVALNVDFHEALYGKAQKPQTLAILYRLRISLEPYLRLLWSRTGYQAQSQADHREILSLCRSRKIKAAQRLLRHHVERTGEEIELLLRSRSKSRE